MSGNGQRENAGLCLTCGNAPVCCHRLKRGYDAIYCEMFNDCVDSPDENRAVGDKDLSSPVLEPGRFKGLCINCANRETCKLIKPDEGIWHCEEYC